MSALFLYPDEQAARVVRAALDALVASRDADEALRQEARTIANAVQSLMVLDPHLLDLKRFARTERALDSAAQRLQRRGHAASDELAVVGLAIQALRSGAQRLRGQHGGPTAAALLKLAERRLRGVIGAI